MFVQEVLAVTLKKYIGSTVHLIYLDRKGRISQRRVVVWSEDGKYLEGYCLARKARRVFKIKNILAVMPVGRRYAV